MRPTRLTPILLVAALLVGCSESGEHSAAGCKPTAVPSHDAKTLVIEGDPWSGYAPFRNNRLLDGTGYKTLYVEQLCQDIRAGDLTNGDADLIVTTLDQYVLHHPEGTVVGVIDQSEGADALALNTVALPYLKSVDNVPTLLERYGGHKPVLAYTGNSPSEMLLNELVNTSEQLRLADFELVSVDQSATAYKLLRDSKAQLAVIWEPDVSAARAAGYTIAASSKDVPDSIVDVIVASNRRLAADSAAVQAVVRSFYSAMDRYLANPAELEQLIAKDGGIDVAAARSVIAGIKLYGSRDADVFMNDKVFPLDQPRVKQSVKAIAAVLALGHPGVDVDRAKLDGHFVGTVAGRG